VVVQYAYCIRNSTATFYDHCLATYYRIRNLADRRNGATGFLTAATAARINDHSIVHNVDNAGNPRQISDAVFNTRLTQQSGNLPAMVRLMVEKM
jgi:hypothetical protein